MCPYLFSRTVRLHLGHCQGSSVKKRIAYIKKQYFLKEYQDNQLYQIQGTSRDATTLGESSGNPRNKVIRISAPRARQLL